MLRPYVMGLLLQRLITQKKKKREKQNGHAAIERHDFCLEIQPASTSSFESPARLDKNAVQVAGDAYVGEGMHSW
jgi:hypothetical protein